MGDPARAITDEQSRAKPANLRLVRFSNEPPKLASRMHQAKRWVILAVSLLLVSGSTSYWFWSKSPSYSLYQVTAALSSDDYQTLAQFTDFQAIVENSSPMITQQALSEHAKKSLVVHLKHELKRYYSNKASLSSIRTIAHYGPILATFLRHDKRLKLVGYSHTEVNDMHANFGIFVFISRYHATINPHLTLEKKAGMWKITAVDNLDSIYREITLLEQAYSQKRNNPIQLKMKQALQVDNFTKQDLDQRFAASKQIVLGAQLHNVSSRPIKSYILHLSIRDDQNRTVGNIDLRGGYLDAGESELGEWEQTIDPYDRQKLALLTQKNLQLSASISKIEFADGELIQLID